MQTDLSALDGLIGSLDELATLPDHVQDSMLNAMADIVVSKQKSKAASMGVQDTGLMIDSIQKDRKVGHGANGAHINVYPGGTRRRGKTSTRNAEIAFIAEYGKGGQPGRPFISQANEECADEVAAAGARVFDKYLSSKNL